MMKHGDLNKFIKYDTKVTNVTFDEEKKTFLVQTTSADNIGTPHTEETFDYVIVATGHFWAPNFPEFPGIEKFTGRVLHAHDYKCAKVELVPKELNHLVAILHVYAGGLNFMK